MNLKSIAIMGIRGIPARHGGFETFAEYLALYLVKEGWQVTVYCQSEIGGTTGENVWKGVQLVHIPVRASGSLGSILFDWKTVRLAAREQTSLILTLGYNTAFFCALYRLKRKTNLMNMDGLEWKRDKWGMIAKCWLWFNEKAGARLANHLIADHPEIKKHLSSLVPEDKITMIPYGADSIIEASLENLEFFGLQPNKYVLVIARPEPENSILEIVKAFSRKYRGFKLVLIGSYDPEGNLYHQKILKAASDEVMMPGAIYDRDQVNSLRFFCRLYVHGHKVGGTNPSLVEALGAGSAVLAHDNKFNRWVTAGKAEYFSDQSACEKAFDLILSNDDRLTEMRHQSRIRHQECYTWQEVLTQYKNLLDANLN